MSDRTTDARKTFAGRLRELRLDAGLSGRRLSELSGIHNTKVSRIEHARQSPSEDDIRAWCIACRAESEIPDLIATHREVEQMWVEAKRELRAGMRRVQARSLGLYERTRLLRVYESHVVPGILQTGDYIRAVMRAGARLFDLPDGEIEAAAKARLARQGLVTSGRNKYHFLIESGVLGIRYGGVAVMREQLGFLESVSTLPNVALGIIPEHRLRAIWPGEGFYIFDEQLVRSEHWTGGFRTTRKTEIATFIRIFDMLRAQAVYGTEVRKMIEFARQDLQTSENP